MPQIIAKKCGFVFTPPMLVIIYQVDNESTPRSAGGATKSRSPQKMRKHVIPLRLLLNERSDIYELLQRLGETKEHGRFVKSVPVQQLVSLIELLQRKQRGENVEADIRKRREAGGRKNGQPGATPERQISAINEEDENSSLRNSMRSTSSISASKDKDDIKSPSKSDSSAKTTPRKKLQEELDLNKVSEAELQQRKAEMDVLFEKNAKRPGDAGYVYDKEVDFDADNHEDAASWDEDEDGDSSSSSSDGRTRSRSDSTSASAAKKPEAKASSATATPVKQSSLPSKAPDNRADDDSDSDWLISAGRKKDKNKEDDHYDAAFEFDDEDDFEFDAKAKPTGSPSRIPVLKRQFASTKKAQDADEDLPF